MSEENAARVQELLEAFRGRDHDREFELLAENVVWDCRRVPIPGCDEVFHRHRGVTTFWRRWLDAWATIEWDQVEITSVGEQVLVGFRQRNLGRESGIWVDQNPWWGLYEVKDGLIVHFTYFNDRDEAIAAASLE